MATIEKSLPPKNVNRVTRNKKYVNIFHFKSKSIRLKQKLSLITEHMCNMQYTILRSSLAK